MARPHHLHPLHPHGLRRRPQRLRGQGLRQHRLGVTAARDPTDAAGTAAEGRGCGAGTGPARSTSAPGLPAVPASQATPQRRAHAWGRMRTLAAGAAVSLLAACSLVEPPAPPSGPQAVDPGVRQGSASAGGELAGLSRAEIAAFEAGRTDFADTESVADGLGPSFNLDSCGGCHLHPALGGSSPPSNPQVGAATREGATNRLPPFIHPDGPVREARFVRNPDGSADGGVHALFTIAGRSDATGCTLAQPDFAAELAKGNLIFRIPTPTFGAGLIEAIPDAEIARNLSRDAMTIKAELGIKGRANVVLPFHTISGQPNRNGNDGTFGRFGWKAQNKSLLVFSGEAYNVEMGITSEAFPTERDETPGCQFRPVPNSITALDAATPIEALSSIEKFALFMRFLDAPQPSADRPGGAESITRGRAQFEALGCALCHTPRLQTGNTSVSALRRQGVALYSDLLLHDMGRGLADGIAQGQASGSEFRSAPLWGLGQRLFLLHDGRTSDLRTAIEEHASPGSEANGVIRRWQRLPEPGKQDLMNFLRSL